MITAAELSELELQCENAIAQASAFTDACKSIAERHNLDPGGLKAHITAKVRDTLAKLEARQDTLAQLRLFEHNGSGE